MYYSVQGAQVPVMNVCARFSVTDDDGEKRKKITNRRGARII